MTEMEIATALAHASTVARRGSRIIDHHGSVCGLNLMPLIHLDVMLWLSSLLPVRSSCSSTSSVPSAFLGTDIPVLEEASGPPRVLRGLQAGLVLSNSSFIHRHSSVNAVYSRSLHYQCYTRELDLPLLLFPLFPLIGTLSLPSRRRSYFASW